MNTLMYKIYFNLVPWSHDPKLLKTLNVNLKLVKFKCLAVNSLNSIEVSEKLSIFNFSELWLKGLKDIH